MTLSIALLTVMASLWLADAVMASNSLMKFLSALGSISWSITYPTGNPVAGATVAINTTPLETKTTGADGRFEFKVAPGIYEVSVVDAGFVVASQVADARAADATVDFTVSRISGTVFSIDGPSLSNAAVLFDARTVAAGPGGAYSALVVPALHNLSGCAAGFECRGKHADVSEKNSKVDFFLIPAGKVTKRVGVVAAEFTDITHDPSQTVEWLERRADNLSRYYWRQSDGLAGIEYTSLTGQWVSVDRRSTDYSLDQCRLPFTNTITLVDDAIRKAGVSAAGLDGIMVIHPPIPNTASGLFCPFTNKARAQTGSYGIWAHEVGHLLFGFADFYSGTTLGLLTSRGDLKFLDLMGRGSLMNPSAPLSSPLRLAAGWLAELDLGPFFGTLFIQDFQVKLLADIRTDDKVTTVPAAPLILESKYIFEGRSPPDEVIEDADSGLFRLFQLREGTPGVEVYQSEPIIGTWALPNQDALAQHRKEDYTLPTLLPGGAPLKDYSRGVSYGVSSVRTDSGFTVFATPLFLSNVRILTVAPAITSPSTSASAPPLVPADFDVDLHAFTPGGLHVGKNYTTETFELEVPGSDVSPTPGSGLESIVLPANVTAFYTVDPTVALRWLDEYNQVAPSRNLPTLRPEEINVTVTMVSTRYDQAGNRAESPAIIFNMTLEKPRVLAAPARVDMDPDTLNLRSQGRWVTAYLELSSPLNASDIDPDSVAITTINSHRLSQPLDTESHPTEIGDHDANGVADLMLKIERQVIASRLVPGSSTITVGGFTRQGLPFEGDAIIRVIR